MCVQWCPNIVSGHSYNSQMKDKPSTTTKKKQKRFVPTVAQYKEDPEVLREAGPNAILRSVLQGGSPRARKIDKQEK